MDAEKDELEKRAERGDAAACLALADAFERRKHFLDARIWLHRAALAGDVQAAVRLAWRLIAFPPFAPADGMNWAKSAHARGAPEATHILALGHAAGMGVEQNWILALDFLLHAATGGHHPAKIQLAALAEEWALAHALKNGASVQPDSVSLRRAISLSSLLQTPAAITLHEAPRIGHVQQFLSPDACGWLKELGAPHMERAQVYDVETGALTDQQERTNRAAGIDFTRADMVVHLARARLASVLGLPLSGLEDSIILHYATGEEFSPHYDFFHEAASGHLQELNNGQRVATFLIYLNDDYTGGETAFPQLGFSFRGAMGDALLFWNASLEGVPDARTLHAGQPVLSGEKWLFSQWVRHKPG